MTEASEHPPAGLRPPDGQSDGVGAVPGLVRIAVSAWWHTTGWAVNTSLGASRRLLEVALKPEKAPGLVQDARDAARKTVRDLLDVADVPIPNAVRAHDRTAPTGDTGVGSHASNGSVSSSLRDEGEALLRRSRDVNYSEDAHPAYARILSELAPDEGRILSLLLLQGPQPAVDVRTGGPIGFVSSRLLAPGLTMIGPRAGCRYVDRTPSYLHNLFRLGMVWFSRETLPDPLPYQVLEAQPDVLGAIHSVRYAKIVRRSIHLTPFGEDFCRRTLWSEGDSPELLPQHSRPPEVEIAPVRTAELET